MAVDTHDTSSSKHDSNKIWVIYNSYLSHVFVMIGKVTALGADSNNHSSHEDFVKTFESSWRRPGSHSVARLFYKLGNCALRQPMEEFCKDLHHTHTKTLWFQTT